MSLFCRKAFVHRSDFWPMYFPMFAGPVASAGTVSETPPAASMPQKAQPAPFKIPKSLSEVDNGKILGFGAELAEGHPGFADEAYKQRRVDICKIASKHEM